MSLLADAVGSGFEDEESVRKAAYGQHERDRQRGTHDAAGDDRGAADNAGNNAEGADA